MKLINIFILVIMFVKTVDSQHFTVDPASGCGSVEVNFTNNHPSNGYIPQMFITTGFTYHWDFGNGDTSIDENPSPIIYNSPGQYNIQYNVTIDTIGFEINKIVLDGYLGCDDPWPATNVEVYIELFDNNGNILMNTVNEADNHNVDPTANNHIEFLLGAVNVGSNIPLWLTIMDKDAADSDDNCIDDQEGNGTMIPIQLPPNDENGFFETTRIINATTLNGPLTITVYFNKPVLMFSQTTTVDVYQLPQSPTVDNQNLNVCVGSSMPQVTASGDNIEWFDDIELSNLIHSGNIFTPNLTIEDSTYTFYVTQTDSIHSCKSLPTEVTIDYRRLQPPTFINYSSNICYGQVMPNFVAVGENIRWYSDENLQNLIDTGDTLHLTSYEIGENTFYCTQSNNEQTCVSEPALLTFTVSEPVQASITTNSVSCFDAYDGSAYVEIISGAAPFEFKWSNGDTTQNLTNVQAGNYTLTIKDKNFCIYVFDAIIETPDDINITTNIEYGTCPYDEFGKITAMVTGGTGNYTYQWSNGSALNFIDSLTGTFYTLTVTDEHSCQKIAEIEINKGEKFVVKKIIDKPTCPDMSDGKISIITSGGTPPYSFHWTNGATDTILENLSAGIYPLTITDSKGCVHTENINVENTYDICLVPASVLTPNGDGKNDFWKIKFIELHPQAEIFVYSRTGRLVFHATGYNSDWDGTFNGKELPVGSYMYIIDLKNNYEPITGYLDIIR